MGAHIFGADTWHTGAYVAPSTRENRDNVTRLCGEHDLDIKNTRYTKAPGQLATHRLIGALVGAPFTIDNYAQLDCPQPAQMEEHNPQC